MLSIEEVVFRAFRCEWSFIHLSELFYAFGIQVAFTSLSDDVKYYLIMSATMTCVSLFTIQLKEATVK